MAKVLRLLEKMHLLNVTDDGEPEPQEATPSAPSGGAEPEPETLTEPPPVKVIRLSTPRFDHLDEAESELAPEDFPLEKVFASAGITEPEHGFSVYTLIEMLEADEFRELDAPTRAKVIVGMLRRLPSGPVEIDDIVRDAAERDRALDAFEAFLADRLARTTAELEDANRLLQQEIDELTRRNSGLMQANRDRITAERQRFERWQVHKRSEESRLHEAVAPFVDSNPVTQEDADSQKPGFQDHAGGPDSV